MQTPPDTYFLRDDQWLLGQHELQHWPKRSISLWTGQHYNYPGPNPGAEERMLRFGFEARISDMLTLMLSEQRGAGIGIPLPTMPDEDSVTALLDSLHADLESLIHTPLADPAAADALPSDLWLRAVTTRLSRPPEAYNQHSAALGQILKQHGIAHRPRDPHFFEFLFEDLPVRSQAHAYHPCILFDFFLMDACALQGSVRELLLHTLLMLNHNSTQFSSMSIGLDRRHFIVASAYAGIEELRHHFQLYLERWLELASEIRVLCKTLVLDGIAMEYELVPGPVAEIE